MKKIIIIMLCLTACKSRQTSIDRIDATSQTVSQSIQKTQISKTDTSSKHTEAQTNSSLQDTSILEIIPDTGSVQRIQIKRGEAFNYAGKAKHISWKQKNNSLIVNKVDMQQKNGIALNSNLTDSKSQKTHSTTIDKTKIIKTKQNHAFTWIAIALITVVATCLYVYFKLKP